MQKRVNQAVMITCLLNLIFLGFMAFNRWSARAATEHFYKSEAVDDQHRSPISVTINAAVTPESAVIPRNGGTGTIQPCVSVGPVPPNYSAQTFAITTSAPANPQKVELADGAQAKTWTTKKLASGDSDCASGSDIYTIQTKTSNQNTGTLTYQIFGQPATNVTFKDSSQVIIVQ